VRKLLPDQMGVDTARRQNHRQGRARRANLFIGQNDMGAAAAHRFFGFGLNARDGGADVVIRGLLAVPDIERAVDVARRRAHIFAHGRELGISQQRARQLQQFALPRGLIENVAEIAQARVQGHRPRLAQGIDRRIGDLAEFLAKEMRQGAIVARQHRQRRVVAHRPDRFLAAFRHGMQHQLKVFQRDAIGRLTADQLFLRERRLARLTRGDDRTQVGRVLDPRAIGLARGQLVP